MAKYVGETNVLKTVAHPLFAREMLVPEDYKFYGNGAERAKFEKAYEWAGAYKRSRRGSSRVCVLEPFAGAGVLSLIYSHFGFMTRGVEANSSLFRALEANLDEDKTEHSLSNCDNSVFLSQMKSNDMGINIIDLDAYGSCVPQIVEAARILGRGLLFVTAGDIMAGARFKDWSFTKVRYGVDFYGDEQDYPREVLYAFVNREFRKRGKKTELLDRFAFRTMCRICVSVS